MSRVIAAVLVLLVSSAVALRDDFPRVVLRDAPLVTFPAETDKVAGRVARFFMKGESRWEIVFERR